MANLTKGKETLAMTKLSSWLDGFLTGEIVIKDPKTWHYRIYRFWREKTGGNPHWYNENLCHYVRVLVIWAPWNWFKLQNLFLFVRPWTLAYLAGLALLYAYHFSGQKEQMGFWQVLGRLGIFTIGALGVLWTSYKMNKDDDATEERYDRKQKGTNWLIRILSPFMALLAVIVLVGGYGWPEFKYAAGWTWDKAFDPWLTPLARWYFRRSVLHKWITPFTMTVLIGLILLTIYFTPWVLLGLAFIVGVIIVIPLGSLVTVLVEALVKWMRDWRRRRQPARYVRVYTGPSRTERITDMLGLAVRFAVAKKRRICPLMIFPGESSV